MLVSTCTDAASSKCCVLFAGRGQCLFIIQLVLATKRMLPFLMENGESTVDWSAQLIVILCILFRVWLSYIVLFVTYHVRRHAQVRIVSQERQITSDEMYNTPVCIHTAVQNLLSQSFSESIS